MPTSDRPDAEPDPIRAWMGVRVDGNQTREVIANLPGEPGGAALHDTPGGWDLQADALTQRIGQSRGAQLRMRSPRIGDERQQLRGELVRGARARLVAQQAGQAALLKVGPCLAEQGARLAAGLGRLADRALVYGYPPQPLVLHLQPVAGVEECGPP